MRGTVASIMVKRLVINQSDSVSAWVAPRVGRSVAWKGATAIGLEQDGALIAGVVYDGYLAGARISMHCAGDGKRWLNREFLFACFDYPFRQLGVNVIINTVNADNADSIRFTRHIGFEEVARIPGGSGDCDLVIFALQRAKCRFISQEVRDGVHIKKAA